MKFPFRPGDQDCILCGGKSEDWFHVLCLCAACCGIHNLDDRDGHTVEGIFSQSIASSNTRCANAHAYTAFQRRREFLDAVSSTYDGRRIVWLWLTATRSLCFALVVFCDVLYVASYAERYLAV